MNEKDRLVERVKAAMAGHGHNTRDLEALMSVGHTAVERFVNGERAGEQVQAVMREYLARSERGDFKPDDDRLAGVVSINERPKSPITRERELQHHPTDFIDRVGSLINYSRANCRIVLGLAEFGAGKTYAAQTWRERHRDVPSMLFTFDQFTSRHSQAFLEAFGQQILGPNRVPYVSTQNSYSVFKQVVAFLNESPHVLIFDQCEAVRVRLLQQIRDVWDMTQCPIVLLAAPSLGQRLNRGRSGDLGALRSRIGTQDELTGLTAHDTAAILKREGVRQIDDASIGLLHEAVNGSMRYLLEAIDLIQSRHKGKRVGEKTVRSVCKRLMGVRIRVEARARIEQGVAVADDARDSKGGA